MDLTDLIKTKIGVTSYQPSFLTSYHIVPLTYVQVNIGTGLRRRGRFLNNFSGRINSAY